MASNSPTVRTTRRRLHALGTGVPPLDVDVDVDVDVDTLDEHLPSLATLLEARAFAADEEPQVIRITRDGVSEQGIDVGLRLINDIDDSVVSCAHRFRRARRLARHRGVDRRQRLSGRPGSRRAAPPGPARPSRLPRRFVGVGGPLGGRGAAASRPRSRRRHDDRPGRRRLPASSRLGHRAGGEHPRVLGAAVARACVRCRRGANHVGCPGRVAPGRPVPGRRLRPGARPPARVQASSASVPSCPRSSTGRCFGPIAGPAAGRSTACRRPWLGGSTTARSPAGCWAACRPATSCSRPRANCSLPPLGRRVHAAFRHWGLDPPA